MKGGKPKSVTEAKSKESSNKRILAAFESSPPFMFAVKAIFEAIRLSSNEPDSENTEVCPENKPEELGAVKLKVIPPDRL